MTVILKIASLTPAVIVLTAGVGLADAREPVCSCAILVAAGRVLGLVGDIVICQPEPIGFLPGIIDFVLGTFAASCLFDRTVQIASLC